MKLKNLMTMFLCAALTCLGTISFAQTTVSGTVMDSDLNEPLIGANVIIAGTSEGASTEFDGTFSITSSQPLPWTLEVTYAGYGDQQITIDGPTTGLVVNMITEALVGEEVVISASRRREKIQEAPASISVLTARKLSATPNDNAARAIINEPGVYIQQQGAGRVNVQLRGDGGIFGSATFPILDYRSLSGPGLGTFDNLNSPLNNIDMERIEVVRGPGSALYGPGVTAGVVHFITKSPIDRPGTTIEVVGGELNTFGTAIRHATKVSDKFGFKINAAFKKGDEFTYDPNDPTDKAILDQLIPQFSDGSGGFLTRGIYAPAISGGVVDPLGSPTLLLPLSEMDGHSVELPMQDFYSQFLVTGTLEFRPQDDLSVVVSGGANGASAPFFNSQGPGLSQATETWAQARVQKGGFFAQAFWLNNNGGTDKNPTFLYATSNTTGINRTQLEAQLQYNFDTPKFLNANWTVGYDYRLSQADTENTVYGREEDDDNFAIHGGYAQTKLELAPKLDLVLAGRYDVFNFLDEGAFSPRAVFVYKPDPKHTFRFGYNRAVGAPSQLQVNIDFPVSGFNVPGVGTVGYAWLVGNKQAQTFGDDPMIVWNSVLQGLGVPNLPVGTPGLPNAVTYGAATEGLLPNLLPVLVQNMIDGGVPASLAQSVGTNIGGYLGNPANFPSGFTGEFNGYNLFNREPLGLIDAPAAQLRTEDTWEFGYKGLIADKIGVSLDIYNRKIDGSTLFTGISPTYQLDNVDIANDLVSNINFAGLESFITSELAAIGPAAAPTAAALTAGIQGGYSQAAAATEAAFLPAIQGFGAAYVLAWTPTQQLPTSGVPLYAAGYRTFEEFDYWGADLGLSYYVDQDLSFFFNYTLTSENQFNPKIVGVEGTALTSISQPKNRYRLGFNYTPELGFRANLAFQHDPSFPVFLGSFFSGDTDEKNLIDAGFGYKWENGLSIDLTAQNLLDNEYRTFPQFPMIGRRVLAKITYSFGENP